MDEIKYPWQQAVMDAFLAYPEELAAKIHLAEREILGRLRESRDLTMDERLALHDALRALRVLISELRASRPESSDDKKATEDLG